MKNQSSEGNLGQGELSPAQAPQRFTPVVLIHDIEHNQELVGVRESGHHGYVYHQKDEDSSNA